MGAWHNAELLDVVIDVRILGKADPDRGRHRNQNGSGCFARSPLTEFYREPTGAGGTGAPSRVEFGA
jgi:hypothetical protein